MYKTSPAFFPASRLQAHLQSTVAATLIRHFCELYLLSRFRLLLQPYIWRHANRSLLRPLGVDHVPFAGPRMAPCGIRGPSVVGEGLESLQEAAKQ